MNQSHGTSEVSDGWKGGERKYYTSESASMEKLEKKLKRHLICKAQVRRPWYFLCNNVLRMTFENEYVRLPQQSDDALATQGELGRKTFLLVLHFVKVKPNKV